MNRMAWLGLLDSKACFIGWIRSRNRSSARFIGQFPWTNHNAC